MADRTHDMSRDLAGAVNLMAHPLAGAAALSAVGVGVASQALGMWLGAMAGMVDASERLVQSTLKGAQGGPSAKTSAAVRARARSLMEEAQSYAREVGGKVVDNAATPARGSAGASKTAGKSKPSPAARTSEAPVAGSSRPKAIDRPASPDDLKAISGIGPKLEQVLNRLGIWTYAQIADWGAQEIAGVEDHLGLKGRIGRDGWVAQAKALAASAESAG
jgi:NADH-quinone oxidoreductase subunit E